MTMIRKSPVAIIAILALAFTSCTKDSEITVQKANSKCDEYNIRTKYETIVAFYACSTGEYEVHKLNAGVNMFYSAQPGTMKVFEMKDKVTINNESNIAIDPVAGQPY